MIRLRRHKIDWIFLPVGYIRGSPCCAGVLYCPRDEISVRGRFHGSSLLACVDARKCTTGKKNHKKKYNNAVRDCGTIQTYRKPTRTYTCYIFFNRIKEASVCRASARRTFVTENLRDADISLEARVRHGLFFGG